MSEYTRRATWEDVLHVVKLLKDNDVQFILVGGYALRMYGYSRDTFDIDIAVDTSPENSKKWILALSHLPDKATAELSGEDEPFDGDYKHAIRINDEITIDVMPSVAGIPFSELQNYTNEIMIKGTKIPVLDLKGLLLAKEKSPRDQDKQDVKFIKEVLSKFDELDS